MPRKLIDPTKAKIVDNQLAVVNNYNPGATRSSKTLDEVLNSQMLILERITQQLSEKSVTGLNKDEIQSLATCIKLTMELKAKENELLDGMSDEELERLSKT